MIPDKVSCVPATENVLPLAPSEIAPLKELVPVDVAKVPLLMMSASAPRTRFCKSSVAPLAMVAALPEAQVKYMTAQIPMKRCCQLDEVAATASRNLR